MLVTLMFMGKGFLTAMIIVALGAGAVTASAEYEGVTPGADNLPPRAEEIPANAVMLTWPGLVMRSDGTSSFFVQTSKRVPVATREAAGRFELVLRRTKVYLKNSFLPLETQFFATPVTRATVQRNGQSDLIMVFEMRDAVTPTVRQEKGKDGFNYVFVDFGPRP